MDSYFKISNMTEKLRIFSQLLVHKNLAEENQANLWSFTKFTKISPCQSFCIVSEVHNKFLKKLVNPKVAVITVHSAATDGKNET